MATERMTSADVVAVNSSEDVVGVIVEKTGNYPEWQVVPASPVQKTTYKTLVRTATPSVGFLGVDGGRERKSATLAARTVECKNFDASWEISKGAATGVDWGQDQAFAIQRAAHIEAQMGAIASQFYYGTGADANGFAGIASLADGLSEDTVLDATGTSANAATSVYLVKLGTDAVSFAWGNDGTIETSDVRPETLYADGSVAQKMPGYVQDINGWIGLQTTNQKSVVRICNLTAQSGKGLTDALLYSALEQFYDISGGNPDAIFMASQSAVQLQQSRVATNTTGAPAPFATSIDGMNGITVPMYVSSAISKTEAIIT